MSSNNEQPIVLQANGPAQASIIWLHGLGADGNDFVDVVKMLDLLKLGVRFVLPHAPMRSVTINNGMRMRAWYDIQSTQINEDEDRDGINASFELVQTWIKQEQKSGINPDKIVIAGFSQGAAVSLYSSIRHSDRLAGVIALSGYLPFEQQFEPEALVHNRGIPLFMAHGKFDAVIPIKIAQSSQDVLRDYFQLQWQSYPMEHNVCVEEITALRVWLLRTLDL